MLNNRLATTLYKFNILSPNNWAGLPGGSTQQPIYILNNVLEEAREFKKEIWVFSQNISKAYDSINKEMLQLAFQRIKISTQIINIIINTITNRKNKVIIAYGLIEA